MAAKKWNMAAAVASHLVKVDIHAPRRARIAGKIKSDHGNLGKVPAQNLIAATYFTGDETSHH
jgi:hypothetical protein